MAERPILFSGPMVRALLAGTKTQTRRVVKASGWAPESAEYTGRVKVGFSKDERIGVQAYFEHRDSQSWHGVRCPYGAPGSMLWVREAWRVARKYDAVKPRDLSPRAMTVEYEAGGYACNSPWDSGQWSVSEDIAPREHPEWVGKLRPSMFMPRWASRITLLVTDVRVERLQEITANDARAEGCPDKPVPGAERASVDALAKLWFHDLWESINGSGSWDANPWVWVVSFERVGGANG